MDNDLGISIEEKVHRIKAYLDETMTPEEEVEFQRWLDTSVANRVLLDRIRDERILLNKIRFAERNDKGKGWDNIQKKIRKSIVIVNLYLLKFLKLFNLEIKYYILLQKIF